MQTPNFQPAPLVLVKAKETYQFWHKGLINLNRLDRNTIGGKIDDIFLSLLELIFRSCFAYDKFEKLSLISLAIGKNDLLKFLLQIVWEQKIISHQCYGALIISLDEIGRMLGGWKKACKKKTSVNKSRKKPNWSPKQSRQSPPSQPFSKLPKLKFQSPSKSR